LRSADVDTRTLIGRATRQRSLALRVFGEHGSPVASVSAGCCKQAGGA
jgi:hypothetical protein